MVGDAVVISTALTTLMYSHLVKAPGFLVCVRMLMASEGQFGGLPFQEQLPRPQRAGAAAAAPMHDSRPYEVLEKCDNLYK